LKPALRIEHQRAFLRFEPNHFPEELDELLELELLDEFDELLELELLEELDELLELELLDEFDELLELELLDELLATRV